MPPVLHVHEFGTPEGPPLLALHGVTGHGARWRRLGEKQLAHFRVIAPDLRGHGRSPRLPPWTMEQHAADLLTVIDGYQLASVAIVAHSFGGAIALHLMRLARERISRVVLLDPAVGIDPALALERAELPARVFPSIEGARAAQRYDWPTAGDDVIDEELEYNLERVAAGWRHRWSPPAVATAWSEMSRAPLLPHPGTPTLLVPALRQQHVPPEYISACQIALGDDIEVVGLNCGHVIYLERPDDTADLVNGFVLRD